MWSFSYKSKSSYWKYHLKISCFVGEIKIYSINQFKSTLKDLVIEDNKNLNNINIYNNNLILLRKLIENIKFQYHSH